MRDGGGDPLAQPGAHEGRGALARQHRQHPGGGGGREVEEAVGGGGLRWRRPGSAFMPKPRSTKPRAAASRPRSPICAGVVGQAPGQEAGIGEGAPAQIVEVGQVGTQQARRARRSVPCASREPRAPAGSASAARSTMAQS